MPKREAWLDSLRLLAAFLVIVNHTNSDLFQATMPTQGTWWLSITWYYVCKMGVPLFVMISGACLLHKQDRISKSLGRAWRMLWVLLLFSYAYYLHDAWVAGELEARATDFGTFFSLVWTQKIRDSFWYLYFYIGMMLVLPMLQRLNNSMKERERYYFISLCFVVDAIWPLLVHYVPDLALPGYFQVPLATGYIGLFYAGQWLRTMYEPTRKKTLISLAVLIASLAASVLLTKNEFALGVKYWFMDSRTQPSIFSIIGAICVVNIIMHLIQGESKVMAVLGRGAFGIYLLQEWVIAQTETSWFLPLCNIMPAFPAVIVWEIEIFLVCLAAAVILRCVPGLKKLI